MHYMLTEQSAAIAAESYGHYDGKPALLVVTSGPGVTNSLTGVAAAWTNSTPIFVISGQARSIDVKKAKKGSSRQIGNQHLNTEMLCSSIVKKFVEPTDDFDAVRIVQSLHDQSITGRMGPVWLSIPQDLQRRIAQEELLEKSHDINITSENADQEAAFLILKELELANKPLLFLGNGVRTNKSQDDFATIAEKYDAAVVTTWTGMDLFSSNHRLFSGRPGTIASSWEANLVQQAADLVVVLGARLDLAQIGFQPSNFAPNAKVIRIDIDDAEFDRITNDGRVTNIHLSAPSVVAQILKHLPRDLIAKEAWRKEINKYRLLPAAGKFRDSQSGLSTYQVVEELVKLEASDVVLGSSGTCVEMVLQSWKVTSGQRFLNSGGLGSMGFALAASLGVGAKTKHPKMLVIESDGSLAMNIQDLKTLSATKFPLKKIVILNSRGYKSISISQKKQNQTIHGATFETGLNLPDIALWSHAAGINHQRVESEAELTSAIASMWNSNRHEILEVMVSREEEALPRLMSKANDSGQMVTADFAELSPPLN
jgi:acetolactate synthase-1/2/3 large subunit